MVTQVPAPEISEQLSLAQQIKSAGLLKRKPWYSIRKHGTTLLLYLAGFALLWTVGSSWACLAVAAYLALMTGQMALSGHDIGHRQALASKENSNRLSLLFGNLLICLSTGWWNGKHLPHHLKPNVLGEDPDVFPGGLVFTKEQAATRGRFGKLISRYQAWLFFPMAALEGLNLHAQSIRAVLKGDVEEKRGLEASLLGIHIAAYLSFVFTVLTPLQGIAFVLMHQALWGVYMSVSFAFNHKARPYTEKAASDRLTLQVESSRNLPDRWWSRWLFGGLDAQIEHHLYPSMVRKLLRKARPIVRAHCARPEVNVEYTETGLYQAIKEVLQHLHYVGEDLRAAAAMKRMLRRSARSFL
jgi:fatty acid desaturase